MVRQQDQVFRVDGEEFMVVLPGAHFNAAQQTADRLHRQVEGTVLSGNLRLTVPCGIATPPPGPAKPSAVCCGVPTRRFTRPRPTAAIGSSPRESGKLVISPVGPASRRRQRH